MYFGVSRARLQQRVRQMVHCGELTERGLAHAVGLSQPHVHNMLKGARGFSVDFADRVLHHLSLTLGDLFPEAHPPEHAGFHTFQPVPVLRGRTGDRNFPFTPERHEGIYPFLHRQVAGLTDPVVLTLQGEPAMSPRLQDGDLALLDRSEPARLHTDPSFLYVVETANGTAVRYVRSAGRSLYSFTDASVADRRCWERLSPARKNALESVRGRIVWIGRALTPGLSFAASVGTFGRSPSPEDLSAIAPR